MASKTRRQIITIHILHNISRSKGTQAMKFGQSIRYSARNIFLKNQAYSEVWRLVPDLFLVFKKTK